MAITPLRAHTPRPRRPARPGFTVPLALAVPLSMAVTLGACGGTDHLDAEETATQVDTTVQTVSISLQERFHPIFEELDGAGEADPVPSDLRPDVDTALRATADDLDRAATTLDELAPPADAEDELDALAGAAREQAASLLDLAEQPNLTVGEIAGTLQPPVEELTALVDAGIPVSLPEG